jgi:polar amino acid transport system substrate-binding protein
MKKTSQVPAHFLTLAVIFFLCLSAPGFAGDLKISLAEMPVYAESTDNGVLVELSKALSKELGASLSLAVVPFARSIDNVVKGEADFHMPLIESPGYSNEAPAFDLSTATIFHVNFTLYENKNKPLNMEALKSYTIETDVAHTKYFPFPTIASSCLDCSLKKVDAGRIDGFIFADFASDPLIKANNMKNIRRRQYRVFDVKIVLPKGGRGGELDTRLSKAIEDMRARGDYQKIMDAIDLPYNDWQP